MLIGEILLQEYGIAGRDIDKALKFQERYGGRLGMILINMGVISEEMLVRSLAKQLGVKTVSDSDETGVDFLKLEVPENLNIDFLLKHDWLLTKVDGDGLVFMVTDPLDHEAGQYLRDQGVSFSVRLATESQLREVKSQFLFTRDSGDLNLDRLADLGDSEIDKLKELASEAPVVNMVNSLMARAITSGASDLHFEPYKDMYRVRFRIDGMLHDIDFLPKTMQLPVASRIKILAGLDIAEKRRPQDGKISMRVSSRDVDIRVSTLPLNNGESLVLRFLIQEDIRYELENMGMEDDLLSFMQTDIRRNAGVILLTGPTGSGKTTTLYAALNQLNDSVKKIITIEDPVEYQLEGINQIHIQPDIGYDFPAALRSILRQDPDVIMVGEIRDAETARIAMQSSLTGHLVFSTLHTNDAPSAYVRLVDLGIEEYLINAALISIVAQRLVRKVCRGCAAPLALDDPFFRDPEARRIAELWMDGDLRPAEPRGCKECMATGYRGRTAIIEYLRSNDELRLMDKGEGFVSLAYQFMRRNNIRSLREDGMLKVLRGITTKEEVLRVAG